MTSVSEAARATIFGLRAACAWPDAPRPISAGELLPERALAGDLDATAELKESVFVPLSAEPALMDTAATYLERAGSLEATARILFIHPNTVRYRLKRIAETTGYSITEPRGSFTVRIALTLGRLSAEPPAIL
jgi:DNA-binding PucR family transcriptional regulator